MVTSVSDWLRHGWHVIGLVLLMACSTPNTSISLHVSAASSLTETFQTMCQAFESTHPEYDVELYFAGSQVLRMQIEQGLPTDVFASANEDHMHALVKEQRIQPPVVFAENTLALVYNLTHALELKSEADLVHVKRLVLGVESAPIGAYTHRMLDKMDTHLGNGFRDKVRARVVSYEKNVRLVRAKVELGEADAAIVYSTEATPSSEVGRVSIAARYQVPIHHSIGVTRDTQNADGAKAWVDFVRSEAGQAHLRDHGFGVPQ